MLAKNHDDVGDCTICEAGKFNDDDGDVTNDFSKHGPDSCQVCGQGKYNDYYFLTVHSSLGHPMAAMLRSTDGYSREWNQIGTIWTGKCNKRGEA